MNQGLLSLSAQRMFLIENEPVVILTGNEFSKKEGITLTQQASEHYKVIGGIAISPAYGEIILDKQSVEDDFAHGVGRIKEKLYVHEVSLTRKLLDGSSNPAHIPAAKQGVISDSLTDISNPIQSLDANQGNITKVLQKIISAKN